MNTSTLLVLGVLALLVYAYIQKQGKPPVSPNTTTASGSNGSQQVSADKVFDSVMNSVNKLFDTVQTVAKTSSSSV